jgi:hypothetical protein
LYLFATQQPDMGQNDAGTLLDQRGKVLPSNKRRSHYMGHPIVVYRARLYGYGLLEFP